MSGNRNITIILLLAFSINIPVLSGEWKDPYEMNLKPTREFKIKPLPVVERESENDIPGEKKNEISEDVSIVYLKHFISILLNFPVVNDNGQTALIGEFKLDTESENYRILMEFTKKKNVDINDLRKLDTTLNEVFQRKLSDDILNFISNSRNTISGFIFSLESVLVIVVCSGLFILYNLFKSNFSFWYTIRYFVIILIIIDYGFRYKMLHEEIEEHNMKIQYTSKCDTKNMSWKEYFLFIVEQRDCERKYLTPLEVFLSQVKHIIIIPMSAFGTGMGNFGSELWSKLSGPWKIFIFPVMLSFSAILFAFIISTIKGSPFKITLLRLIHLEFGNQANDSNKISGSTLNKLLDSLGNNHRPMVQDVLPNTRQNNRKQGKPKKHSPSKIQNDMSPRKGQVEDEDGSVELKNTPSKQRTKRQSGTPSSTEKNCSKTESVASSPDISSGKIGGCEIDS